MKNSKIIDLYSYSEEEQRCFFYTEKYMRKVNKHLPDLLDSELGKERFILAGLFLTYRVCNNMGITMSTEFASELSGIHRDRLLFAPTYTNKNIRDTKEYLRLIALNPLKVVFYRCHFSTFLINLALSKKSLNWQ